MPLFQETRNPSEEEIRMLMEIRPDIAKSRGKETKIFKVLSVRSPILENLFHLAKIEMDKDEFFHVQAYFPNGTRQEVALDSIKPALKDEELTIFYLEKML